MSWSSARATWNLKSLHSCVYIICRKRPLRNFRLRSYGKKTNDKKNSEREQKDKTKANSKKCCLAMHPVSLQGDGLCHRYLHVMSRIYWKAEKYLCKAKTINKWYIAGFFQCCKDQTRREDTSKKIQVYMHFKKQLIWKKYFNFFIFFF